MSPKLRDALNSWLILAIGLFGIVVLVVLASWPQNMSGPQAGEQQTAASTPPQNSAPAPRAATTQPTAQPAAQAAPKQPSSGSAPGNQVAAPQPSAQHNHTASPAAAAPRQAQSAPQSSQPSTASQ